MFVCRWLWGDCKGDEEIDAGTNIGGVFFQTCNVFEQFSTIRIKIKHNLGKYMMFFYCCPEYLHRQIVPV